MLRSILGLAELFMGVHSVIPKLMAVRSAVTCLTGRLHASVTRGAVRRMLSHGCEL